MLFKDKVDFKRVFLEYYNPLCNYANNILRNETEAEDMVQDVFVNLWEKRENITITSSLSAYLFLAVKNKVLEHLRSRKTYAQTIENASVQKQLSAEDDTIADQYFRMERLYSLVRHLPPKCQKVFVLHKFKGLTYSEIAEDQNIAIKTVENHMLKAIKLLRSQSSNNKL